MDSLIQLSSNSLEGMDVENVPISDNVMNIDRNKIAAIPKINQPVELQDLTGLSVYDVKHFELEVLHQVTFDYLEPNSVNSSNEAPGTLGVTGVEETENERKIRTGEMTPFGSTDNSQTNTKSSQDMLQTYLASQSKLSTMVQKPKQKILSTKKDSKISLKLNKFETNTKHLVPNEKTIPLSNKESGSEYFPSTESENDTDTRVVTKRKKKSFGRKKHKPSSDKYTDCGSDDEYYETRNCPSSISYKLHSIRCYCNDL